MTLNRRSTLIAALAAACRPALPAHAQHTRKQEAQPITVFAAASLQTALGVIAREWKAAKGADIRMSFAGSAALARQIDQGAPADIFASADLDWMDWAEQRKLLRAGSRRNLLGNRLALIAARGDAVPFAITPGFALAEALGDSRLALGDPASVPAGRYAKAALIHLGVWDKVAPRIAGTDNVRTALSLVTRGEARYGVVYATDARAELSVRVVDTFPAESHPAIVYPFALTADARPEAATFLDYLASPAAARIFERDGFTVLR